MAGIWYHTANLGYRFLASTATADRMALPNPKRFSLTATALRVLPALISIALLGAALWILHDELAELSGERVSAFIQSYAAETLAIALGLTIVSYFLLAVSEAAGLWYAGKTLPFRRAAHVSFISYSFAHNIGLNLLTGGSIRYRMYAADGLRALDVAAVTLFSSVTFAVGSLTLAGISLVHEPQSVLMRLGAPVAGLHILGFAVLGVVAAYLILAFTLRQSVSLWQWSISLPRPEFAVAQVVIGLLDILASAAIVFVLMPADVGMGFIAFAGIYTIATWAGLISHVPGGAGVFEAAMVVMLPNVPKDELIASLLAYRAIYYVLPLIVSAGALAIGEIIEKRTHIGQAAAAIERRMAPILAPTIGLLVFFGGIVLLLSGATPAIDTRMDSLRAVLPLPLVEFSHLVGSVTGTALLILARGLFRRLDGAYFMTAIVLAAGIVVSVLKGLDFEEAIVLGVILLLLLMSRSAFYRRSSLFAEPFSWAWVASIAAAILGSTWIGFFVYSDVDYANDMWLTFAFDGNAERFLRATVAVAVVAIGFGLVRLTRSRSGASVAAPAPADVAAAMQIARGADDTLAQLVGMGDKSILISPSGKSFLMYAIQGQSWIALAAPFGEPDEVRDLAWRFREMCDAADGRPVFYQVAAQDLPLCIDLGLQIIKIGEDAHVPLATFSLEGKRNKDMRLARNRGAREGLTFEIMTPQQVEAEMSALRGVSDAWLAGHRAAEKGFSLGAFREDYIKLLPSAVVRHQGRIIAFANLLEAQSKAELSVDLMRHVEGDIRGVMDFLFAELLLWGKAQGYRSFNLGMAPLSGLESRPLAPLWHRAGAMIYRHGESFYNFKGLRQFKDKFNPEWRPRFIAFPGGLSLPYVLLDVSTLISGGLKEIVSK